MALLARGVSRIIASGQATKLVSTTSMKSLSCGRGLPFAVSRLACSSVGCAGGTAVPQPSHRWFSTPAAESARTASVIEKVRLDSSGVVEVEWSNGGVSSFPYVWLRDNCQCEDCHSAMTGFRCVMIKDIDPFIAPVTAEVVDGKSIQLEWPDGHRSEFEWQWLQDRSFTREAREQRREAKRRKLQLWGSEQLKKLQPVDFEALMTDEMALYEFFNIVDTVGLAFTNNVPCKVGQQQRLAERIAYLRPTHYGLHESSVYSKPNTSNLAFTGQRLHCHTDMPQYSLPAGVLLLHCVQEAEEGGENELIDGYNAAYQLKEKDPEAFHTLTTTPVSFAMHGKDYIRYDLEKTRPIISLNEKGEVARICYANQLRSALMDVPVERVQPFYRAMRAWDDILYHPDNCILMKLNAGEMVVFDNWRLVHGRRGFQGGRHVQTAYMDWDEVRSFLGVVRRERNLDN
ncbi:PREDICTED: gamma-butyrobetaine dioxygenase-like [Branchiostoma belcheri]|uniref:Gamma-butyrobetaine dioxygenase-like n=1 Tax=Branchiostoma belcheri TaxID=7741 RepID=A0A6P4ZLK8_BRABE|nr:PREDICTED: gamma-butyrobetaine dioxygenase-like [Branchiostoma belcheri]XP_019631943.1 PREDICTED: gamma-butyrobetaine dioxygenase-like [Branchiostoma belcheri]